MAFYILSWPDWEAFEQGWYQISEAELGYAMCRDAPAIGSAAITPSNQDFYELWQTGILQTHPYIISFILAGNSPAEFRYQKEMLYHILNNTRGMVQLTSDWNSTTVRFALSTILHSLKQLGVKGFAQGSSKLVHCLRDVVGDKGMRFLPGMLFLGHVRASLNARGVFRLGGASGPRWGALSLRPVP